MRGSAAALLLVGAAAVADPAPRNMNPGRYGIANMPNRSLTLSERSGGKYVDVYTKVIASLYSQVNWDVHDVAFPADFVKEYDGRVVNIVGYEFDIVRPAGAPCVSSSSANPVPCERTSVPSYEQYNHHYNNNLFGKGTKFVKTGIPSTDPMVTHVGGMDGYSIVTDKDVAPAQPAAPATQFLPMGNGAESRLTIKYFPPGYGALLESPTHTTIQPMIIDTKARNTTAGLPPGRHGPVVKASNVGPEEMYSGLMECPCTDAFPRAPATATTLGIGSCAKTSVFADAAACFAAAASLGLTAKANLTVHSKTSPPGCYTTAVSGGFEVAFNSDATSTKVCGSSAAQRQVAMAESVAQETAVDVDIQATPMPDSPSIAGSWIIAGPYATNSIVEILETAPSSGNFSMSCLGPTCTWDTGKGALPGPLFGTVVNGIFNGFKGAPGTVRADRNQITWTNGVIFNRWYPAAKPVSDIAGDYMVLGERATAGATDPWLGGTVTIRGTNAAFTLTYDNPAAKVVDFPGSLTGKTFNAFKGIPGTVSATGNTITFTNGVIYQRLDPASNAGKVVITMTGPAERWIGAGFMAKLPVTLPGSRSGSAMDGTYAVVALGDGSVQERKLGHHTAGTPLARSVTVVSNTVKDGVRTVVVSRPLQGASNNHFTFPKGADSLGLISAVGTSAQFGYHKSHASQKMYFVDVGAPTCVCDEMPPLGSTESQGMIGTVAFTTNCGPLPLGQMLSDPHWNNASTAYTDNKGINPTCQIGAYRGGLHCCAGGTIITDGADARADLVAQNDTDEYQVMYRYYYEDGPAAGAKPPAATTDTYWTYWWTEYNNGEHDIPPCFAEPCVYNITSSWTGADMLGANPAVDSELIHVEGHCHIGCLGMELYNMDDPAAPKLLCRTKIDYGTGDEPQNEMGYILGNQPCLFGNPADGFPEPPVIKTTTKLMSIKYQNNTHARYGDMALWELRAAYRV